MTARDTARARARINRVRALAGAADRADRELGRAIERALRAGHSLRAVEQASGLSRTTIARRFGNGAKP